jgi:hypothetical protein
MVALTGRAQECDESFFAADLNPGTIRPGR